MKNILNDHGVALIIVILMVSIIVAVTLELSRSSRASIYESANVAGRVQMTYLAKSAFNAGAAVLLSDKNPNCDSLNEDWALMEAVATQSAGYFNVDNLSIHIDDESGKIPVHKLISENAYNEDIKKLLVTFLSLPEFGLDEQKAKEIVAALKDWMDADDEISPDGGAESSYYKSLRPSYSSKNKALDCIEELLMIKGITRKLYEGTKDVPGIGKCLTIYGDGKININTAPILVLKALFKDAPAEALEEMDAYRRKQNAGDLSSHTWWSDKIKGLAGIQINTNLIATSSEYFQISAAVELNNVTGRVSGVVRRKANQINLFSWKLE